MRIGQTMGTACAAGVLVAVLAACSGLGGGGGDNSSNGQPPMGPLQEYMNAAFGGNLSQEEQQAMYDEQNRKTEELVAQCMKDQGFEYIPRVDNVVTISYAGDEVDYRPDARDWVEKYGYGAINSPWMEQNGAEVMPTSEPYVDPNQPYLDSLSDSERKAYEEALWGVPQEAVFMDSAESGVATAEPVEYDWTKAGCYGAAQHEVNSFDPYNSDEFRPLMDAMNELYTAMSESPEMKATDAAWASCMATKGYPGLTYQWEGSNLFYEGYLNKFYETWDWNKSGDPMNDPEYQALAETEIKIALDDLDCREETKYRETQADITEAMEQQFIDDHKAELDALLAAAEQGRGGAAG
jgi:hypothetical protein